MSIAAFHCTFDSTIPMLIFEYVILKKVSKNLHVCQPRCICVFLEQVQHLNTYNAAWRESMGRQIQIIAIVCPWGFRGQGAAAGTNYCCSNLCHESLGWEPQLNNGFITKHLKLCLLKAIKIFLALLCLWTTISVDHKICCRYYFSQQIWAVTLVGVKIRWKTKDSKAKSHY